MRVVLSILMCFVLVLNHAQDVNLYPTNGVKQQKDLYYAFTNATLHISGSLTTKGTLLIQNGKIVKVGAIVSLPKGTVKLDMKGKHIYPSFVDVYSNYGQPEIKQGKHDPRPQLETKKKGAFGWNEAVRPEYNTSDHFTANQKSAKELRNIGFGSVLTHRMDGIARGTSALVSLNEGKDRDLIIDPVASTHYSFTKGSSRQSYPSSLMGAIALLRQTFCDADYYSKNKNDLSLDLSLEAFQRNTSLPQIVEANDKFTILRADTIGDEFGHQFIFKGSGNEYQRAKEIKATGGAVIIPLDFPKPYDVSDAYAARLVTLAQMKHWELAASNPKILAANNIDFAITTHGLQKKTDFFGNIRKAIARGLSEADALNALTSVPARMINAQDRVGGLGVGMLANFLVCSGELFEKNTVLLKLGSRR